MMVKCAVTSLRALCDLVPPPVNPVAAQGDWEQVEVKLGVRLPGDYKQLISMYGMGVFGDIFLNTPFSRYFSTGLLTAHPDTRGLLQWASTGNGDQIFWLTSPVGDPDAWPTVIDYRHSEGDSRFELTCTGFLHAYFSSQLAIAEFGPAPDVPWFDPSIDREQVYLKVTGDELPYAQRLQILRQSLGATADRGSWKASEEDEEDDEDRQDHFKVIDRDWLLTYETAYGHTIRLAYPAGHESAAKEAIRAATAAMGVTIASAVPPDWLKPETR